MKNKMDTSRIDESQITKKYNIGYVPGAFDLFHIGHLNLLQKSKAMCNYLIAGVLTDDLYEHFKKKKPLVPFDERIAIVGAIKYVDEVIPVNFENTRKIDAWNQIHFDVHFSGNDHGPEWNRDIEELRQVGATMQFFDYTKGVSSSIRRGSISVSEYKGKLLVFGAGKCGRKFIKNYMRSDIRNKWDIVGFLDNNTDIIHSVVEGYTVYGVDELSFIVPDGMYSVVIAVNNGREDIIRQLTLLGINKVYNEEDILPKQFE